MTNGREVEPTVAPSDGKFKYGFHVGNELRARVVRIIGPKGLEGGQVDVDFTDIMKAVWGYGGGEGEERAKVVKGEGCMAVEEGCYLSVS
jgi:hypothetical protein